jgi:hypothetical protein
MKSVQTHLNKFAEQYNFLWVLYIFFIGFTQIQTLLADLITFPDSLPFIVWTIFMTILYLTSLSAFVFRKRIFPKIVWKYILVLVLLNIPLMFFLIFTGIIPLENKQFNCQETGAFCDFFRFAQFANTILYLLPLYYSLMKLIDTKFEIPFVKYPLFTVKYNDSPNKLLAFPVFGLIAKFIILFPYFLVQWVIGITAFLMQIINYFHILFTGKIWKPAFQYTFWSMSLQANGSAYIFGLTDKYPRFGEMEDPLLSLKFNQEQKSNRLLGSPILGPVLRYIMLLPISTYATYIYYAAGLGLVLSWFAVLFTGKYPKSIYELAQDTIRLQSSITLYSTAMTDKYPSFSISLNHPYKKALLIVLSILLLYIPTLIAQGFNTQP